MCQPLSFPASKHLIRGDKKREPSSGSFEKDRGCERLKVAAHQHASATLEESRVLRENHRFLP